MTTVLLMGDARASNDVVRRKAVKAIVWAESGSARLLLMHTTSGYKFPGGGVEAGEDLTAALARELVEECGADLLHTGPTAVTVIERHPAADRPGAVFEMISHYVECAVVQDGRAQRLDLYEQHLELSPEWVNLIDAVAVNELAVATGAAPRWVVRELTVLRHLRDTEAGRC